MENKKGRGSIYTAPEAAQIGMQRIRRDLCDGSRP